MPDIPVGRIEFSLSGHRYELSGPDIRIRPPVSAAALIKAATAEGAKLERQRIRAKVEEMAAKEAETAAFNREALFNRAAHRELVLRELLRWLDGEGA